MVVVKVAVAVVIFAVFNGYSTDRFYLAPDYFQRQ